MEGVPAPGSVVLGKYRVDNVLGHGGMGSVVQVTDLHTDSVLALKTMLPGLAVDPELKARFLREGQAAERLRSEHVARVFDVGVLPNGSPYIAMEYLEGVDLAEDLQRRMLWPGEVVDYILQACVGLAEAHAEGIIHRDIKPSNIYVTRRSDGSPLIKILDFGISKAPFPGCGLDSTRSDLVMGTPAYMSPEQMKGVKGVDERTDIWSLGIVLYECLVGRRPFDAASFPELVLKVSNEPLPSMPPRIQRGLQAVIRQCLEKDRSDRFPTVVTLASRLAAFSADRHSSKVSVARAQIMMNRRTAGDRGETVRVDAPTMYLRPPAGYSDRRSDGRAPSARWLLVYVCLSLCSLAMIVAGMMIFGWW